MIVRALVVDDEPKARRWLRRLLGEVDWVECVGEASDGIEAVKSARRLKPDLVFLDVRMPGLDGLAALRKLDPRPLAIFTTAFDDAAATAFDLQAIDYLVKPFGRARLAQALARVQRLFDARSTAPSGLFVRDRGRQVAVPFKQISRISAEGDYLRIHSTTREYLLHGRLKTLALSLPDSFLRIHRSHVVNLDRVSAVQPDASQRLRVQLIDGTVVVASRRLSPSLRRSLRVSDQAPSTRTADLRRS